MRIILIIKYIKNNNNKNNINKNNDLSESADSLLMLRMAGDALGVFSMVTRLLWRGV